MGNQTNKKRGKHFFNISNSVNTLKQWKRRHKKKERNNQLAWRKRGLIIIYHRCLDISLQYNHKYLSLNACHLLCSLLIEHQSVQNPQLIVVANDRLALATSSRKIEERNFGFFHFPTDHYQRNPTVVFFSPSFFLSSFLSFFLSF